MQFVLCLHKTRHSALSRTLSQVDWGEVKWSSCLVLGPVHLDYVMCAFPTSDPISPSVTPISGQQAMVLIRLLLAIDCIITWHISQGIVSISVTKMSQMLLWLKHYSISDHEMNVAMLNLFSISFHNLFLSGQKNFHTISINHLIRFKVCYPFFTSWGASQPEFQLTRRHPKTNQAPTTQRSCVSQRV